MEEKYGEVEEMNVCDNLGDHLVGNVYVKVRGLAAEVNLLFPRALMVLAILCRKFKSGLLVLLK